MSFSFFSFCLLRLRLCRRRLIHEVNQAAEGDVAVVGKAHLAGAAGAVPVGARLGKFEVREGGPGELGEAHATVASHATAGDARGGHLFGAQCWFDFSMKPPLSLSRAVGGGHCNRSDGRKENGGGGTSGEEKKQKKFSRPTSHTRRRTHTHKRK